MVIEINNQNREDGDLERIIKQTLRRASVFVKKRKKIPSDCKLRISVAFLSKEEMTKINAVYRGIKNPTDVLSFCYEKNNQELNGEIVFCWEIIKKNARELEVDERKELQNNVIHGLLHIIGFEHGEPMFDFQEEILKSLE